MSTISVPLTADLMSALDNLVADGVGANKADVMRKALRQYAEDRAVEAILRAEKEPNLSGDLDELAAKLS
ncbi:hypothetical protein COY07_01785 [Candidatus Peregrinibacteria bacterium CG_4_10_14_0_2_um_filter_43_11]|nr:MAG: hypothetical protein COY07_01785 [Candidatus Peregrinibacteria bacterium CG_4_10_14_0_2_um_filter_43_11]